MDFFLFNDMSFFSKTLRVTKLAVQFGCFAHAFNQYVAEVTWVNIQVTYISDKTKKKKKIC